METKLRLTPNVKMPQLKLGPAPTGPGKGTFGFDKPAKKPKYLPGETRATCGIDGFTDLRPREWLRAYDERVRQSLYRDRLGTIPIDDSTRNLTPPRHQCPTGSEPHQPAPALYQCTELNNRLSRQARGLDYICRFHERLWSASYSQWRIGQWLWDQAVADTTVGLWI